MALADPDSSRARSTPRPRLSSFTVRARLPVPSLTATQRLAPKRSARISLDSSTSTNNNLTGALGSGHSAGSQSQHAGALNQHDLVPTAPAGPHGSHDGGRGAVGRASHFVGQVLRNRNHRGTGNQMAHLGQAPIEGVFRPKAFVSILEGDVRTSAGGDAGRKNTVRNWPQSTRRCDRPPSPLCLQGCVPAAPDRLQRLRPGLRGPGWWAWESGVVPGRCGGRCRRSSNSAPGPAVAKGPGWGQWKGFQPEGFSGSRKHCRARLFHLHLPATTRAERRS